MLAGPHDIVVDRGVEIQRVVHWGSPEVERDPFAAATIAALLPALPPFLLALGGHHRSTRGRLARGMAEPSADRVVRGGPARGLEEIGGLGAGGPCFRQGLGERESAQREARSEEHTSELQSLMRIPYAVFC